MSVPTEESAGTTAIRSFTIPVTPEAEIEALRARIAATRWPDQELVALVELGEVAGQEVRGERPSVGRGHAGRLASASSRSANGCLRSVRRDGRRRFSG
jgi:hypothetical protein